MSIWLPERTDAPGAIDSDMVAADRPMAAFVARGLARVANHLGDASSTVLAAAWVVPAGGELELDRIWRLVGVWAGCPVRPVHRRAAIRVRSIAASGVQTQLELRMAGATARIDTTGTGTVALATGNIEHAPGIASTTVELWARSGGPSGNASGIGTPVTWTDTTTTLFYTDRVIVDTTSWDTAVISAGDYYVSMYDSSGQLVFRRRISYAIEEASDSTLFFSPGLSIPESNAMRAAEDAGGWDIEIDILGAWAPSSLLVRGEP